MRHVHDTVPHLHSADHSTARLYLISADGSNSVNVGVARVIGGASLDSSEPVFNFIIYPESEEAQPTASARTDTSPANYTNINFQSTRTVQANDGSLEVTEDLIVTRIERPVIVNPREAYAGAEYGEPVVRISSQEVTFDMVPAIRTGAEQNNISISGIARIRGKHFPSCCRPFRGPIGPSLFKIRNSKYLSPWARGTMARYAPERRS